MRKLFIFILLISLCNHGLAQVKLPPPVDSPGVLETNINLFPDSSILLNPAAGEIGTTVARYVYKDGTWQPAPNELTELLNSLVPDEESHLHFRLSIRGDRLFVTLHRNKGKVQRYMESTLVNGQWSHFREILKGVDHEYNRVAFSYSADNQKLYTWAGKEQPEFTTYSLQEGEWKNPVTTKAGAQFLVIYAVIGITNDGVLIQGVHKGSKSAGYYFVKSLGNDEWSAPLRIREFGNGLIDLTLTPFLSTFICGDFANQTVLLINTPSILSKEIAQSRKSEPVGVLATGKAAEITPAESVTTGKYYALLIGNADYQVDRLDLHQPVIDANKLAQTLARYNFDEKDITTLTNASRNQILQELYRLRNQLTPKDNLLIFYAGHGYWDEKIRQGYWWPIDASPDNPANWLSNSDLREQIRGINARHTLLISDACFSGGIFKTRGPEEIRKAGLDIQLLYRMPSRRAITSGTLSSVPDNSVFFRYLIKYLEENQQKFVASGDLFTMIRASVLNNSLTVPQDGVIMDTGDEGGDFIFIKRE